MSVRLGEQTLEATITHPAYITSERSTCLTRVANVAPSFDRARRQPAVAAQVDAAFLAGTSGRSLLLVNVGHGDAEKLDPRLPGSTSTTPGERPEIVGRCRRRSARRWRMLPP
jgi:hypothetical protein